jgi:hypothetical protein
MTTDYENQLINNLFYLLPQSLVVVMIPMKLLPYLLFSMDSGCDCRHHHLLLDWWSMDSGCDCRWHHHLLLDRSEAKTEGERKLIN